MQISSVVETLAKQLAHQAGCCVLVVSGLDENVGYLAVIIDGSPQIHLPTGDGDEHLVEIPSAG